MSRKQRRHPSPRHLAPPPAPRRVAPVASQPSAGSNVVRLDDGRALVARPGTNLREHVQPFDEGQWLREFYRTSAQAEGVDPATAAIQYAEATAHQLSEPRGGVMQLSGAGTA